jgi:hypothetical protein
MMSASSFPLTLQKSQPMRRLKAHQDVTLDLLYLTICCLESAKDKPRLNDALADVNVANVTASYKLFPIHAPDTFTLPRSLTGQFACWVLQHVP